MADYIDTKNNGCIDIWDTTTGCGGSVDDDPDRPGCPIRNENEERWYNLLKDWDSMTFKEKLKLFCPIVHIVLIPDVYPDDFDEYINDEIAIYSYDWCRSVRAIHPNIDDHRVPFFTIIFNPINIDAIPLPDLKAKVKSWYITVRPF